MNGWSDFTGPNEAYMLDLWERYRRDPQSVDEAARAFFAQNPPPSETQPTAAPSAQADLEKAAAALNLAQAIRWYGHWAAQLDPLGAAPASDPALRFDTYNLSEADLRALPATLVGGPAGERAAQAGGSAWEAIQQLRAIYSANIGFDYLQIRGPNERAWLREAAESRRYSSEQQPINRAALLERLTQVEVFEHFLQRSFPGKTRFTIEGLDMLVPLLDEINACAADSGIFNILIGMAHRGRLNVLAHVLDKSITQILAEFKDPVLPRVTEDQHTGWTGDVKYHAGGRHIIDPDNDPETINMTITMAPNPSHLEAVNPVVEGMARAAGTRAGERGPAVFDSSVTLPILVHGDAAFPGQGVVAETLNLYRLRGYTTGGTIHIIANNQIGFTTDPIESRSTLFASDIAKGYRIPVIHVNADDAEGVIEAARTAFAYRERFQRDFLIDLIGYRRVGHNEGDEPAFTQPRMYAKIAAHPSARKILAEQMVQRNEIAAELPDQLYQQRMDALQAALESLDPNALVEPIPPPPPPGAARKVKTSVPAVTLRRLNQELLRLPDGFHLHPRLARIRQRREGMLEEAAGTDPSLDWSAAEELALATILEEGTPVRLTGQDVERGTFSHRHAVLHDAQTGESFVPLQALPGATASFDAFNSPLSEFAALGFEFGYNVEANRHLVIWEAQYGDFINNAQTVVDEFIVSARDKWGQLPSLVLLLPHGYEGQGPDHSSARLERFLNLSADNNLRVAYPTTAANYFHLLRRQAALLTVDPLPLVVMTPKSLLRNPLVASPLHEFSKGGWQPVIPPAQASSAEEAGAEEAGAKEAAGRVRRLVLCTGKVWVDLASGEQAKQQDWLAVARVEQLAPFPEKEVRALITDYTKIEEVVWLQEEPENMGAWEFARPYLENAVAGQAGLRLIARPRSASPAEGSSSIHTFNQRRMVQEASPLLWRSPQEQRSQQEQQGQPALAQQELHSKEADSKKLSDESQKLNANGDQGGAG